MADLCGHVFACRIDSGADEVVIWDSIITFLHRNSVFLPTRNEPRTFKAVDGRVLNSPGEVQISPMITTVAGKCRLRNLCARIVPDEDANVVPGAACAGDIVLGNPFLIKAGLDVTDFVADNLEKLASIDFGTLQSVQPAAKIGKLTAQMLSSQEETSTINPDDVDTVAKLCTLIQNGDFPLRDGDDIDYKDVEIGPRNEEELQSAIEEMTKRAGRHLPKQYHAQLRDIVSKASDVFRVKLSGDPPVDVPPMKIEFEGQSKPMKVRQRTYSPQQTAFLKAKVD